jgi:hypothetical protein
MLLLIIAIWEDIIETSLISKSKIIAETQKAVLLKVVFDKGQSYGKNGEIQFTQKISNIWFPKSKIKDLGGMIRVPSWILNEGKSVFTEHKLSNPNWY